MKPDIILEDLCHLLYMIQYQEDLQEPSYDILDYAKSYVANMALNIKEGQYD